jgi:hypothetical protein
MTIGFDAFPAMLSALLFASLPSNAATIQCPRSITEKPTVSSADPAWSVVAVSGERQVQHAGVYTGIAAEYGAQVPDSTTTTDREERVTWHIPKRDSETFWIGCSYAGTTAMLTIELKPGMESCVASYALLPSGKRQRLKHIDCR